MNQDGTYLDHTLLEILESMENYWQLRLRGKAQKQAKYAYFVF